MVIYIGFHYVIYVTYTQVAVNLPWCVCYVTPTQFCVLLVS